MTLPLLIPIAVVACSSEKTIERQEQSSPDQSKSYCPYEITNAEDASGFISDLAGNWVYGTRLKVEEEGAFKDTYVQSGFEIRSNAKDMMDVNLRFPNLTQKSASLVETKTRFNFKELKISAPIKTDDGEFRLMVFRQTDGTLGKFDCAVTAMRRDKDASGREIVLVKGWEYNRSNTTEAKPEMKSVEAFLKEKSTSTYFRHDAGTSATGNEASGTGSGTGGTTEPTTPTVVPPKTPTIDNASFNHWTNLRFDPKNIVHAVPTEIVTVCESKQWVTRFNEMEILQAAKSTIGYTRDFANCEKIEITLKSDTVSPTMKTYKMMLDHRAIWKLDNRGDGEIIIDVQKLISEGQLQPKS
jgi:hypothetical protein